MVLLDSTDAFLRELQGMFELCKQRAAGTVYITLKSAKAGKGAAPGESEGWLARAKISNKKARKISVSVRERESHATTVVIQFGVELLIFSTITAQCWQALYTNECTIDIVGVVGVLPFFSSSTSIMVYEYDGCAGDRVLVLHLARCNRHWTQLERF